MSSTLSGVSETRRIAPRRKGCFDQSGGSRGTLHSGPSQGDFQGRRSTSDLLTLSVCPAAVCAAPASWATKIRSVLRRSRDAISLDWAAVQEKWLLLISGPPVFFCVGHACLQEIGWLFWVVLVVSEFPVFSVYFGVRWSLGNAAVLFVTVAHELFGSLYAWRVARRS